MTDLGPINMKQHLSDQARKMSRLERMLGGILRPKAGLPSYPSTSIVDTSRTNDLSRYGARLVVWTFSVSSTGTFSNGALIATAPVGFRPPGDDLFTVWGALGSSAPPALVYLQNDGSLRFNSCSAACSFVAGTVTFTAASP